MLRTYLIWKVSSPSTGESAIIADAWEPCPIVHNFQKVIATVQARNAGDALLAYQGL